MPLEAAWLLMAVEIPYLAAFGVASGLAMRFESPVILILSAATVAAVSAMVAGRLAAMVYLLPRTARALAPAAAPTPQPTGHPSC